jgi:hypothetical protein
MHTDVILAHTTPATLAVQQETRAIPTVFFQVADPVGSGIVASFSRPTGNVTGFTTVEPTMGGEGNPEKNRSAETCRLMAAAPTPLATTSTENAVGPQTSPCLETDRPLLTDEKKSEDEVH